MEGSRFNASATFASLGLGLLSASLGGISPQDRRRSVFPWVSPNHTPEKYRSRFLQSVHGVLAHARPGRWAPTFCEA